VTTLLDVMRDQLHVIGDCADAHRRSLYGPDCPACKVPCVKPHDNPDYMEECPQCRWPFNGVIHLPAGKK